MTLILPIWSLGQIIIVNGVTIHIDYDNDRICIDIYECNRCLLGGIQSDICECRRECHSESYNQEFHD